MVLYGPYSRLFWAFPLFAAPAGTIVTATTPSDLVARMRAAESSADTPLTTHRRPS
jgi:hypothetical protein